MEVSEGSVLAINVMSLIWIGYVPNGHFAQLK
jgi:hypothetical protein